MSQSHALPPFHPNDPNSDAVWLSLCTPQDRLSYKAAKGHYDVQAASADLTIAAATGVKDKAADAFLHVRAVTYGRLHG